MSNSLNLELPYLQAAQAQKHVTVNEALRRIDATVQLVVENRTLAAPPPAPAEGTRYIVASGASGAWTGHDLEVAAYLDAAWMFFVPREGWLVFVREEAAYVWYTGSSWDVMVTAGDAETASRFGVNAVADDDNRLIVKAAAALYAPDPTLSVADEFAGDAQIKVTKDAPDKVASHLFQTNYSGRAEFGLIGSDDFSLKVSADGQSFQEAFNVDRQSARVDFPRPPRIGGTAGIALALPSRTALEAAAIPAEVTRVETCGFAAESDGGGGVYERVASLPADGLGVADSAGGFWSLAGDWVRVRQAGAVGDGTTDDTAAMRRAFLSGRNVFIDAGRFRVTDALPTGGTNQRIVGDGRHVASIEVDGAFNLSAAGVIDVAHGFTAISDLAIRFDQSSATGRGSLFAYPPAVVVEGVPHGRLSRFAMERAFDGIVMRGDAGGWILDDVECGALNVGFEIDGPEDVVECRACRVWPYGFSDDATLDAGIYRDGSTIGFRLGKVDGLKMMSCSVLSARIVTFESADGSGPSGQILGLSLDGEFATFDHAKGQLTVSALNSWKNGPDDYHINVTNGAQMFVSSFSMAIGVGSSVPLVRVDAGSVLTLSGGQAVTDDADNVMFEVTGGQLKIENTRLVADGSVVRALPLVRQRTGSGQLVMVGNSVTPLTAGSGVAVDVGTDGRHVIIGNQLGGYTLAAPGPLTLALIGPNGV